MTRALPVIDPADLAACRALLRGGSRSFHLASFLLPRRVRDPAAGLYAFCRLADDAIDCGDDGAAALAQLHARLERAYAGRPFPCPADRALASVVARFAIPAALPAALLEGLAWDAAGRRYETIDDLTAYAVRVAGTVGIMMALVMGVRAPDALARACALGVAMQLTNIARDVGEDARAGRLYLPCAWLRDHGLDPAAWGPQTAFAPAIGAVVARLLEQADAFYRYAGAGIAALPAPCRPGIAAAGALYAAIGTELARRAFDSISGRAAVPAASKLRAVAAGLARRADRAAMAPAPLAAARFLLAAIPAGAPARPRQTLHARIEGRAIFTLELFYRLALRERLELPDR